MARWQETKIRSGDTWEQVRRAWEGGETAASVARRYDVGLANLWRRRAAEGWYRREVGDPTPEPVEGWDRYAERKRDQFMIELKGQRELALDLMETLKGGPLEDAPLWHLGFVLAYRAEHLGPEVAAADRERAGAAPWAGAVWDEDGRMRDIDHVDNLLMQMYRDRWREQVGLPESVAPGWP